MTTTTTEPVRVQANHTRVKHLGHWTTAREFQVRAHRGHAVLDLRSPRIPDGDLHVTVGLDHGVLTLLLPEDAVLDSWDLHLIGRGKVKDAVGGAGDKAAVGGAGGRRIVLDGAVQHGEIRVHRGGVAVLSALFSREFLADARRAHREGGTPTVADPAHTA